MQALQHIITTAFDFLLIPEQFLGSLAGLTLISVLSGILLLWIFGKVSNQNKIRATKSKISGALLEVVLFRHDIGVCLRAQGRMLANAMRYLSLSIPPVLILSIPCILIMAQLNLRYGALPLGGSHSSLVSVRLANAEQLYKVSLQPSGDLSITPPVRTTTPPEIFWRVDVPNNPAEQSAHLTLRMDGDQSNYQFPLAVTANPGAISTQWSTSLLGQLLYPTKGPTSKLPNSIEQINLTYPQAEFSFLGLSFGWLSFFLVVSLVSGLIASKFMGVAI